jgi:preprotein translocase subunit SecF
VQVIGQPAERRFQIRLEATDASASTAAAQAVSSEKVLNTLEAKFGKGNVSIITSNFVGQSYSKGLINQTMILMLATIVLILIYTAFRFKPKFAFGAVLAIIHDALIMTAFMVWTRMEFNTTSIAAILTILGYSINDTIVIFDRVREESRIFPDLDFRTLLDHAISDCLSRTLMTTLTTMVAVLSLLIFTTGDMRRFAAALMVGLVSGCYSTVYIASGFANLWTNVSNNRAKKRKANGEYSKAPKAQKTPKAVAAGTIATAKA